MKTIQLAAAFLALSATTAFADCLAVRDYDRRPACLAGAAAGTGGMRVDQERRRPRAVSPARRSARHVGQAAGRARRPPLKAGQARQDRSGRARRARPVGEGLCLVPALWRAPREPRGFTSTRAPGSCR